MKLNKQIPIGCFHYIKTILCKDIDEYEERINREYFIFDDKTLTYKLKNDDGRYGVFTQEYLDAVDR